MNVIFLDIDGVLNSDLYFKSIKGKRIETENEIDESRLPLLQKIVKENNAKVVLSSTWRDFEDTDSVPAQNMWDYLVKTLKKYDIEIMSKTPIIEQIRPLEIRTWIENQHNKENIHWISIEDNWSEEMYEEYGIGGHLIETKFFTLDEKKAALQESHVTLARKLFREQEK